MTGLQLLNGKLWPVGWADGWWGLATWTMNSVVSMGAETLQKASWFLLIPKKQTNNKTKTQWGGGPEADQQTWAKKHQIITWERLRVLEFYSLRLQQLKSKVNSLKYQIFIFQVSFWIYTDTGLPNYVIRIFNILEHSTFPKHNSLLILGPTFC